MYYSGSIIFLFVISVAFAIHVESWLISKLASGLIHSIFMLIFLILVLTCQDAGFNSCCSAVDCSAGACYCDETCYGFDDCCPDINETCPLG